MFSRSGILPESHYEALVEIQQGESEMVFQTSQPVEVVSNVFTTVKTGSKHEEIEIKGATLHYFTTDKKLIFKIKVPNPGKYSFNIYAKTLNDPNPLPWVCSYILSSIDTIEDFQPFPVPMLGPVDDKNSCLLELMSHSSPIIQCENGSLELIFKGNIYTRIILEHYESSNTSVVKTGYVWTSREQDVLKYIFSFKHSGIYTFKIMLIDEHKNEDSVQSKNHNVKTYTHLYTCLINVAIPQSSHRVFPTRYDEWKDTYRLEKPRTSPLESHSLVGFNLFVPDALTLVVVQGDNWSDLEKNKDGNWSGDVQTSGSGEMVLRAQYGGSESYQGLLSYKVKYI